MAEARSAGAEIRGLLSPDTGRSALSKADERLLIQRGHEARERLEARAQSEERALREQEENIASSERYIASRSEHQRTMDARDRVAAQIARTTGLAFTEAQRTVAESMQRSRRR